MERFFLSLLLFFLNGCGFKNTNSLSYHATVGMDLAFIAPNQPSQRNDKRAQLIIKVVINEIKFFSRNVIKHSMCWQTGVLPFALSLHLSRHNRLESVQVHEMAEENSDIETGTERKKMERNLYFYAFWTCLHCRLTSFSSFWAIFFVILSSHANVKKKKKKQK